MSDRTRAKSTKTTKPTTVSLSELRSDPSRVLKQADRGPVTVIDDTGKQKLVISSPIVTAKDLAG